nr:MAG TPA: hypothetical protein [Caudoviricetes sp.]
MTTRYQRHLQAERISCDMESLSLQTISESSGTIEEKIKPVQVGVLSCKNKRNV